MAAARNEGCDGVVDFRLPSTSTVMVGRREDDEKFGKFASPIEQKSYRLGMVKSPPRRCAESNSHLKFEQQRSRNRQQKGGHQRAAKNWTSGGPGMQAIFLGPSNQRCCGTGVFLPRREGTGFQCSSKPVLLPARVVQALNLNVHELGLLINKPQPEHHELKNNSLKKRHEKLEEKQKQRQAADDIISLSPEIFLPKEWTY
ncbi:uncharacterized protein LOC127243019 isoform X2 [Andrographis paniculata]|uniref:uncharacterized protein LOC127243019 isoform X2 n=1 Tax=Andrographis paniculata TaxID=175694 RepID=UPI0021E84642|nr:uncharacterized protein LOC127243019 isoform X2 [Andrographis paniculata]